MEERSQLEAVIRITLGEEDYREPVEKELKTLQKKAQMPGFRPGKVPLGLVKKMYGKSVLVEEVNKILADALFNYIKEEDLQVLGNPMPDQEKADGIDWDQQKEFTFEYHVGLAPEIELELNGDMAFDYHQIQVGDEMLEDYLTNIRQRYGKMTNPDVAEAGDVLMGEFVEMAGENEPKTDGHTHSANLFIKFIRDSGVREQLIGSKAGSQVVMDVLKAVESESEAAGMLGLKKEELSDYGPLFRFTVDSISRLEPAEMDEELFSKVARDQEINTEEDFREFVRKQVSQQYQVDADKHFKNVVREKLLETTNVNLPETFLKKWLVDNNKEELTPEKVEAEFDQFADSFRWQLLESHLTKKYGIEVNPGEVNTHLEDYVKAQLKQYGQDEVPQEMLDQYVKNIASKEEEVKKVYDQLYDQKLLDLFKEKFTLKEQTISYDDFALLVSEKYKKYTEPGAGATQDGEAEEGQEKQKQ